MPETTNILFWSIGGSLIILLSLLFLINYILNQYNKKELEYYTELKLQNVEKQKAILSNRIEVQEETIQKISREIHDNVNQLLTLTKLNINSLYDSSEEDLESKIKMANELLTAAIKELTNLSRSLSAEKVYEYGLIKSLESEISRITQIEKINISLRVLNVEKILNQEVSLVLYRVFQEALRNAIIHGKAKNITVILDIIKENIDLSIEDDGIGFDINQSDSLFDRKGMGLINMRKRATLVNGSFEITSELQKGTKIKIIIPHALPETSVNDLISHAIHD